MFRKKRKALKSENRDVSNLATVSNIAFINRRTVRETRFDLFNPHKHKANDLTTTKTWQAWLLAGNIILTETLYKVPYIFKECGIISSIIVSGVVLLFCIYGYLSMFRLMFKICRKERIDYISYGKLARYTLCRLPKSKIIARISTYFINTLIVVSLLFRMAICVLNGNRAFSYLLNLTYEVDKSDRMAVIVLSLPYFLTVSTVPRLPLLTAFSIIGLVALVFQMVLQIVICSYDMGEKHEYNFFGEFSFIPDLVTCLLVGTGSFPVILAIEKEMINPRQFIKPLGIGNFIMTISNFNAILFGMLGYFTYGNSVLPNVRDNFSPVIPKYLIETSHLIQLLCTFPLFVYGIMSILMNELLLPHITFPQPIFIELPIRFLWVLISFGFAELWNFSAHLENIFFKINAFILAILTFLIPGILGIMIRYPRDYGKRNIFLISDIVLVVLTLCLLCLFIFWATK